MRQPVPERIQTTGILEGIAFDSLTMKPLPGATVELLQPARSVVADKNGRFRMDSVPIGTRRLAFSSPELDSIGLFAFARDFEVATGRQSIRLTTPSMATFYDRLCPAQANPIRDSAIVFGTVYDARSGAALDSAHVSFAWYTVMTDGKGVRLGEASREAITDSAGAYVICGLPSDITVTTTATRSGASSGRITQIVGNARLLRREFRVSDDFNASGSAGRSGSNGVVRGLVVDEKGGALSNALVMLIASDRVTRTDNQGRFTFANAPLGTQELSVRQIGAGAVYQVVDVRADVAAEDLRITLPSTATLTRVNVRAERTAGSDRAGYLRRRKMGIGEFIDEKEIAMRPDVASVLQRITGLLVEKTMLGLKINVRRPGCGAPLIVIDGFPASGRGTTSTIPLDATAPVQMMSPAEARLNALNPRDIVAVEYHTGANMVPMEYGNASRPDCGMLLVWTVFARW
ncbi:MAG: carboxypeptidase regulatory-like domain-containing protein [Gemmatimonadaceae bacterium]|nr:carboxypeptidase regulatory-like domain-containing protein [Gemmatimonadaceae bacterium]